MHNLKNNKPLVSIILPVFNAEKFLKLCLKSLSLQTYKNIEIIAIDDFSCDKSYQILTSFKKRCKKLKVYRNIKHYGNQITLNRAIKRSKGKFMAFMSPCDISYKNRLQRQLSFLMKNQKVCAVGSQYTVIDDKGRILEKSNLPIGHEDISAKPLHGLSVQFESLMINKYVLPKDILRLDPHSKRLMYSDILAKLMQYAKIVNLAYPLIYRRKYASSNEIIKRNMLMPIKLWLHSVIEHEYYPSLRSLYSLILKPNL